MYHGGDWEEMSGRIYDGHVVRRLVPYLRPYKKRVILGVAAMITGAFASYTQPLLIGLMIRDYVGDGDLHGIDIMAFLLVGLALLSWGSQYVQQISTAYMGQRVVYRLR